MRCTLLLVAAALTFMSTASAQTVEDRLVKARTEVNTAENAAGRADTACATSKQPKCTDEVHATKLALGRALYAIDKALEAVRSTPTPTPTPTPIPCSDGSSVIPPAVCPPPPPPPPVDCGNGVTVPAGQTCPAPPPPPPPPQTPGTGLPPIASNGPLAIKSAGIPARQPQVNEDKGAFRFICGAAQLSYDDPIMFPGQPGMSHLHQYYGNTGANADSTFQSLRTSGDSTCNIDTTHTMVPANRSAYWMPAMLDGKGSVVMPDYVQAYYKRQPNNSLYDDTPSICDPANTAVGSAASWGGKCFGIPNGLKFIVGFNMKTGQLGAGSFNCVTAAGASSAVFKDIPSLKGDPKCIAGSRLEARIASNVCWNGQLDSADHISHLMPMQPTSSGRKVCPATHKDMLAQVFFSSFYLITATDDLALWQWSSDAMYPSLAHGTTLHFDYAEAWDSDAKDEWVENCINGYRNSSAGNLCGGHALNGADSGTVGIVAKTFPHRVPVPANPHAMH